MKQLDISLNVMMIWQATCIMKLWRTEAQEKRRMSWKNMQQRYKEQYNGEHNWRKLYNNTDELQMRLLHSRWVSGRRLDPPLLLLGLMLVGSSLTFLSLLLLSTSIA